MERFCTRKHGKPRNAALRPRGTACSGLCSLPSCMMIDRGAPQHLCIPKGMQRCWARNTFSTTRWGDLSRISRYDPVFLAQKDPPALWSPTPSVTLQGLHRHSLVHDHRSPGEVLALHWKGGEAYKEKGKKENSSYAERPKMHTIVTCPTVLNPQEPLSEALS